MAEGHSLQCYFPEFVHPAGTLSATAKLIEEGSSYPPHINDASKYGGYYEVTAAAITFTTVGIDTSNILTVSENSPVYSASNKQYVNTKYQSSYELILTTSTAL